MSKTLLSSALLILINLSGKFYKILMSFFFVQWFIFVLNIKKKPTCAGGQLTKEYTFLFHFLFFSILYFSVKLNY